MSFSIIIESGTAAQGSPDHVYHDFYYFSTFLSNIRETTLQNEKCSNESHKSGIEMNPRYLTVDLSIYNWVCSGRRRGGGIGCVYRIPTNITSVLSS